MSVGLVVLEDVWSVCFFLVGIGDEDGAGRLMLADVESM